MRPYLLEVMETTEAGPEIWADLCRFMSPSDQPRYR